MKNWSAYILPAVFGIMLILPGLNDVLDVWQFERGDENRNVEKRPSPKLNRLDVYPDQFEKYYNDHFSFRSPLLKLNSHIKFEYFNISPHPEKALVGKEDWYFMSQKEKKIFEGKLDFSEEDLKNFERIWTYRKETLDNKGIPFYWLIAPMKHYVYEDLMPFQIVRSNSERRVLTLKKILENEIGDFIVDPMEALKAVSENEKVFYRQDNHWNESGGFIATEMLMERIRKDFPEVELLQRDNYTWIDSAKFGGIHCTLMGIEAVDEADIWAKQSRFDVKEIDPYGFEVEEQFPYPSDYEKRFIRSDATDLPRVLIIRDSFAEQMMPFLTSSFQESTLIFDSWQYKLNEHIIDSVKPDLIIFLGLETHLENMFIDLENMD